MLKSALSSIAVLDASGKTRSDSCTRQSRDVPIVPHRVCVATSSVQPVQDHNVLEHKEQGESTISYATPEYHNSDRFSFGREGNNRTSSGHAHESATGGDVATCAFGNGEASGESVFRLT